MGYVYDNLPKLFFSEVLSTFYKHFYQWHMLTLLPFSLLSYPPISTAITKVLFNEPVRNVVTDYQFLDVKIHHLLFMKYIFEKFLFLTFSMVHSLQSTNIQLKRYYLVLIYSKTTIRT